MIPLGTDRDPSRPTPVTFTVAALCVAVAIVAAVQMRGGSTELVGGEPMPKVIAALAVLPGHGSEIWRWVTYAFTHDWSGIWHLVGNMIFLLAFGRAVERRLGSTGFLALFALSAVLSGVVQELIEPRSALVGASGAICGVTGAFLALFPRARVRFLNLFLLLGIFSLPAPIAVGLQVFFDVYGFLGKGEGVAYGAHLAGYAAGFLSMVVLLASGALPRTEWDVVYAWKQRNRRNAMRKAIEESEQRGPWTGDSTAPPKRKRRSSAKKSATTAAADAQSSASGDAPRQSRPPKTKPSPEAPVRLALNRHDDDVASDQWAELKDTDKKAFTTPELIRIGNSLAARERWRDAVGAWSLALPRLEGGSQADDVRLLAAVISLRRMGDGSAALRFLDGIREAASAATKSTAAALRAEAAAT